MKLKHLRPQVSTVGLVAHYKLWAGLMAASKVFDYSLNGNLGILKGTIVFKYPGVDFNGTDEYIEIADHADFSFGDGSDDSPFSISAWIYMDNSSLFIASKYATNQYEWAFYTSAGKIRFTIYKLDAETSYQRRIYNTALSTGQWHHVVVTYDGRGGTSAVAGIKIYIAGTRKDDAEITGGTYGAMSDGTAPFYIGRHASNYTDGLIDDIRVFKKELSIAEIKSIYESTRWRYGV